MAKKSETETPDNNPPASTPPASETPASTTPAADPGEGYAHHILFRGGVVHTNNPRYAESLKNRGGKDVK